MTRIANLGVDLAKRGNHIASIAAVVALAGCVAPSEQTDIVYDVRHGEAGLLDIYVPDPASQSSGEIPAGSGEDLLRPTVLFIHGGSWTSGDKSNFRNAGARLARSGFVAVSINYRLLPDGVFPNNIEDCICALAYLRGHATEYGIDPDRIAVMGYSAGAHLASLVGVASSNPELAPDCEAAGGLPVAPPAAVISASGPQDMRLWWHEVNDPSRINAIFGGTPDALPHAYDLGSPRYHVRAGLPPFLLLHDALDFGGVGAFRTALVDAGNDAMLLQIAGSLHIFEQHDDAGFYELGVASETPEAWIAIEDFLYRTIGGPR